MDPNISEVLLSAEAQRLYMNYALSVITSRAIPDVRDGLKPVQRRILYAMQSELRVGPDAKPAKCARIVGDVIGKYHPHGDSAVYDALVRLAQPWMMRSPLVVGQGNFGNQDGDAAAAYRYTEAKLAPIAMELLEELGRKTVSFRPTFDAERTEPVVLPARFPNLLVNGAQGIAVGMATSIPPHNLREVVQACTALIADRNLSPAKLMKWVKGPDFPTGGELVSSRAEIRQAYETGSGTLKLRGEYKVESTKGGSQIVITSIPYGIEKRVIVEKIAEVIVSKKLPALVDVRDESTDDVRVVLELKKDTDPDLVVAYLYKHTPLQTNVTVNLTCLLPSDNPLVPTPDRLDLRAMLLHFLDFREEVVRNRLSHDLDQIEKRLHILEGFERVFDALDEIIRIIRGSDGRADAASKIMKKFDLDEVQTDAILELRLYRLAKLEILVIRKEADEKRKEQKRLQGLLKSPAKRWKLIEQEMEALLERYADRRRTKIVGADKEVSFSEADFIVDEDAYVILTERGWVKRQGTVRDLGSTRVKEGDRVLACVAGSTRSSLAFFSSRGACYVSRIADVPASTGYGDPLQKLFKLGDGERIVAMASLDPRISTIPEDEEVYEDGTPCPPYGVAVTRKGLALRFPLWPHREPSTRAGRRYAKLKDGDEVVEVFIQSEEDAGWVLVATDDGHGLAVDVEELAVLAGPGRGTQLVKLGAGAEVLAVRFVSDDSPLFVRTEAGKRYALKAPDLEGPRASRGKAVVKRSGFAAAEPWEPEVPELPEWDEEG